MGSLNKFSDNTIVIQKNVQQIPRHLATIKQIRRCFWLNNHPSLNINASWHSEIDADRMIHETTLEEPEGK